MLNKETKELKIGNKLQKNNVIEKFTNTIKLIILF